MSTLNLLKMVRKRTSQPTDVRPRKYVRRRGAATKQSVAAVDYDGNDDGDRLPRVISYKDPWKNLARVPLKYFKAVVDDFALNVDPIDLVTIKVLNYLRFVIPWHKIDAFFNEYFASKRSMGAFFASYSARVDAKNDVEAVKSEIKSRSAKRYARPKSDFVVNEPLTGVGKRAASVEALTECVSKYKSPDVGWLPAGKNSVVGMAIRKPGYYALAYGSDETLKGKHGITRKGWVAVKEREWYAYLCSGKRKFKANEVAYVVRRGDGDKIDLVVETREMFDESELERQFGKLRLSPVDANLSDRLLNAISSEFANDEILSDAIDPINIRDAFMSSFVVNQDLINSVARSIAAVKGAISRDKFYRLVADPTMFASEDWSEATRNADTRLAVLEKLNAHLARGKRSSRKIVVKQLGEIGIENAGEIYDAMLNAYSEEDDLIAAIADVSSIFFQDDFVDKMRDSPVDFAKANWNQVLVVDETVKRISKKLFNESVEATYGEYATRNRDRREMFTMGSCESTLRSAPWIKNGDDTIVGMAVKNPGVYAKFASDERVKRDWYKVNSEKWYRFACSGKRKFVRRQAAFVTKSGALITETAKMFADSERHLFSRGGIPTNDLAVSDDYIASAIKMISENPVIRESGLSAKLVVDEIGAMDSNAQLADAVIDALIFLHPLISQKQSFVELVRNGRISERNLVRLSRMDDYKSYGLPEIFINSSVDKSSVDVVETRIRRKRQLLESEFYAVNAPEKRVSKYTPLSAGKAYFNVPLPTCDETTADDQIVYYRDKTSESMHCFNVDVIKGKLVNPANGNALSYEFLQYVSMIDDKGTHGSSKLKPLSSERAASSIVASTDELAPGLIERLRDEMLALNGVNCESCSVQVFNPTITTVNDRQKLAFCSHACFERYQV